MDWRAAFIAQARSDFAVATILGSRPDVSPCQVLHSLQMALEKLAKGMACPPGGMDRPRKTHRGAADLVRAMRLSGDHSAAFHRALGMNDRQREMYLRKIRPLVAMIEALAPDLAGDGPNAEYPWAAINAEPPSVVPPAEYSFPIREDEIFRVMRFARTLLASCD